MTTGIIKGTGYRARTVADKYRGAIAPSVLPAWMFINGVLPPPYQWNPVGTSGSTSVQTAYQRGVFASAPWTIPGGPGLFGGGLLAQDADVGACLTPGGANTSGQHFGSWFPRCGAYSGGALRQADSFYILAGAGHSLGFNNIVLGLPLEDAVPLWEPVSPGTPVSQIQGTPTGGNCNGPGGAAYTSAIPRFLDGRNVGGHSGYANQFLQDENKFAISRCLGLGGSGGSGWVLRLFDWASKGTTSSVTGWNAPPPATQFPVMYSTGAGYGDAMCYASRGGVGHIYFPAAPPSQNLRIYVWVYPGTTIAPISNLASIGTAQTNCRGMCYDSVLDRLVIIDSATWTWHTWDCTTGAHATGALINPNSYAPVAVGNPTPNTCLEYDSVANRYLLNVSDSKGTDYANWWAISPGMSLTKLPITNAPPQTLLNGTLNGLLTFNRARHVPNLGIVVCANSDNDRADTQVYWMRTN